MFNQKDTQQIEGRGASMRQVKEQLEHFRTGFPWMKIVGPATPKRGIKVLDDKAADEAVAYYGKAVIRGKRSLVIARGAK